MRKMEKEITSWWAHPANTRRDFLRAAGLFAAGSLLLPELGRSMMTARVNNVGIQLYTVRKEMLADPVGTLRQLAKIGFRELESARSEKGNYYGLSPKEIKKITGDLGMRLRSGHIHVDKDWQKSIEEATETGQEYLISAVLPSQGQTIEHYQESADAFNKLGEECKKARLSFGYHNHDTEFETVKGQVLYDILLDRADPSLVKMEMDLGWVVASGHDPLHYFSKYPGRFPLWHLKDMDTTRKQSTEFGKGQVNIKQLLQHAKQAGMKHFFLEQEEYAHSAFESAQIDYTYLTRLDY
ncbi:MAG TPA: sugar phosphate isomerase/epimerase [Puia sp.]|jgi:sugar phosphate isomerase/epimerase|nr:sugar phosphate isomerase/epimerase [Puia sp.]